MTRLSSIKQLAVWFMAVSLVLLALGRQSLVVSKFLLALESPPSTTTTTTNNNSSNADSTSTFRLASGRIDVLAFMNSTQDYVILGNPNLTLTPHTKAFVLSPHKSGTTTLGAALQMLGFADFGNKPYYSRQILDCNTKALRRPPNGQPFPAHPTARQFTTYMRPALRENSPRTVYQDSPWNHGNCYKQLQANLPDALFILYVREPTSWVRSFTNWAISTKKDSYRGAPGKCFLRSGYGRFQTNKDNYVSWIDQNEWIQGRVQRDQEIVDFFTGQPPTTTPFNLSFQRGCHDFGIDSSLAGAGNSSTLLLMRKFGWEPFAALGFDVPDQAFPRKNAQAYEE